MCSQHWAVFGAWRHVSRCRLGVCALRCFATAVYCNGTVRKKKKRVIARFQTTRLFPRVDNHPACRPRGAVFTDWRIHGHTVHRGPAGSSLVLRRFVVCPLSHRSPHNTLLLVTQKFFLLRIRHTAGSTKKSPRAVLHTVFTCLQTLRPTLLCPFPEPSATTRGLE